MMPSWTSENARVISNCRLLLKWHLSKIQGFLTFMLQKNFVIARFSFTQNFWISDNKLFPWLPLAYKQNFSKFHYQVFAIHLLHISFFFQAMQTVGTSRLMFPWIDNLRCVILNKYKEISISVFSTISTTIWNTTGVLLKVSEQGGV